MLKTWNVKSFNAHIVMLVTYCLMSSCVWLHYEFLFLCFWQALLTCKQKKLNWLIMLEPYLSWITSTLPQKSSFLRFITFWFIFTFVNLLYVLVCLIYIFLILQAGTLAAVMVRDIGQVRCCSIFSCIWSMNISHCKNWYFIYYCHFFVVRILSRQLLMKNVRLLLHWSEINSFSVVSCMH